METNNMEMYEAPKVEVIEVELLCKPLHNISYANKFIMQSDLN